MSFIQQYDRLFLLTFGLVNVVRGGGLLLELALHLTGSGPAGSPGGSGGATALGLSALIHMAVLLVSGVGLLLRRPFGWYLAVLFHASDLTKLAGALLIAVVTAGSTEAVSLGTELLVQMTWALFSLLVFLMKPIARLCRIDPARVIASAAGWIALGVVLAMLKLASVLWGA